MENYNRKVNFFDKNLNSVSAENKIEAGIFSMSGDYDGICGQISDHINPLDIHQEKLIKFWDKYNLNDRKAGTERQEKALSSKKFETFKKHSSVLKSEYEYAIDYLDSINLLVDNGYKYGTQWLARDLPKNIISLTNKIIDDVEKHNENSLKEYTKNLTNNEILEGAINFYGALYADITDSRDVQKRIDRLTVLKIIKTITEEQQKELEQLEEFKDRCFSCSEKFEYGITIVKDNYFVDYAEQKAKEWGLVSHNSGFDPNPVIDHIDWESWANDLKEDYIEVEYRGDTYFAG